MKRLLAAIVLCVCLTAPVRAEDAPSPEALASARELTALVSGNTIQQLTAVMVGQMWPSIEAQLAAKVDAPTLIELRAEIEHSAAALAGDSMKDAPSIYARNFSAQELRDILTFYKTPAGSKALRVMPTVMAEVGASMTPRIAAFQQGLGERMGAIMQKHGYKN